MKITPLVIFLLAAARTAMALDLVQTIPLPGVNGRIDHLSMDQTGKRLFVAALGNNTVEVIDLSTGKVINSIQGLTEPQGVLYLPQLYRLAIANGGDGSCRFFDGTTFQQIRTVPLSGDANNIRHEAKTGRIYVGYGDGGLAVIEPQKMKAEGKIPLGNHPESFQLENTGARAFINTPNSHEIAIADRKTMSIIGKIPLGMVLGNFPMALDEEEHRLYVAYRLPGRLLVFDTSSGKQVAETELHGDCDDLFIDRPRHKTYASCGEGFLDVFDTTGGDKYQREQSVKTAPGARTSWFDGKKIYLAVPRRGTETAEIRIYQS